MAASPPLQRSPTRIPPFEPTEKNVYSVRAGLYRIAREAVELIDGDEHKRLAFLRSKYSFIKKLSSEESDKVLAMLVIQQIRFELNIGFYEPEVPAGY